MSARPIAKFSGLLVASTSAWLLVPLFYSLLTRGSDSMLFLFPAAGGAFLATSLLCIGGDCTAEDVSHKEGIVAATVAWLSAATLGAFPYWLGGTLSFQDAFFESISGFTCTGATCITDLNALSQALLLWRSLTQWIGGMEIMLIALLFISPTGGALQLYQAEFSDPHQGKLTPRIRQSALLLWGTYLFFTLAETLLLYLAGMDLFDAVNHAFTTVSTGGFSTRNGGISSFGLPIKGVILFFMLLTSVNYTLYSRALLNRQLRHFWTNSELRFYLFGIMVSALICTLLLLLSRPGAPHTLLLHALFQVVSTASTTGFFTGNYTLWPMAAQFTLFILMFGSACSHSAGGGIGSMRCLIFLKHTFGEFKRLLNPRAIIPVQLREGTVPTHVVSSCLAFISAYLSIWFIGVLLITLLGIDLAKAIHASAAMLANMGPALGAVGAGGSYATHPQSVKWVYCFLMLCGRLGIYTPLFLLNLTFWKN